MIWSASENWKAAETTSKVAARARASGSVTNQPAITLGKNSTVRALQRVKQAPMIQPLTTMGRSLSCAFAPQASPMRTVRAMERPSGTMKTVAAQVMATWCEARATLPIVPMMMVAATKALTSARSWTEAGRPTFTSERIDGPSGRLNQ